MPSRDFLSDVSAYDILGITRDFASEDISALRKALAKRLHSDVSTENDQRLAEINAACDLLANPETRREYDDLLDERVKARTAQTEREKEAEQKRQARQARAKDQQAQEEARKEFAQSARPTPEATAPPPPPRRPPPPVAPKAPPKRGPAAPTSQRSSTGGWWLMAVAVIVGTIILVAVLASAGSNNRVHVAGQRPTDYSCNGQEWPSDAESPEEGGAIGATQNDLQAKWGGTGGDAEVNIGAGLRVFFGNGINGDGGRSEPIMMMLDQNYQPRWCRALGSEMFDDTVYGIHVRGAHILINWVGDGDCRAQLVVDRATGVLISHRTILAGHCFHGTQPPLEPQPGLSDTKGGS